MSIRVIEQSTSERNAETQRIFEQIRPLLDNGYSYMSALVKTGVVPVTSKKHYYKTGMFKDLKEYGKTQGYPYYEYSGKKRK